MTEPTAPILLDLPTDLIDADALPRDRGHDDPEALAELLHAIAFEGVRQPIEVYEIADAVPGAPCYGLISGFRRLAVVRSLGQPTIPAFVRKPANASAALAAMVSENESRSQVSPWDKARLVVTCLERGLFDTADAALDGLFPMLTRQKRSRMRGHVMVVECLGHILVTPERLTVARLDTLAAALRAGWEEILLNAFPRRTANVSLESQWSAIRPVLDEALSIRPDDAAALPGHPDAPRRMVKLYKGITMRRELTRTGWILRLTGAEAKSPGLVDDIFDMVQYMFESPD